MFRILINEHEESACECLRGVLKQRAFEVASVILPEEVQAAIAAFKPHLLIMNYEYQPVSTMTGLELLEQVRHHYSPEILPVIVASGHCQLDTINRFLRLGIHDFVSKPVSPEYMADLIECCLKP